MQASDDGKPQYGEVSRNSKNVVLAPEKLVLAIWNGARVRALGGQRAWADVHPDFTGESYAYRNSVVRGSLRTVPPDLFKVVTAWYSANPADYGDIKIDPIAGRGRVVL